MHHIEYTTNRQDTWLTIHCTVYWQKLFPNLEVDNVGRIHSYSRAHGGLHFRVLNFGRFHFGSLICGGLTCGKIDLQEDWPAGRLHFGGLHFRWLTCGELTCGGLTCGRLTCGGLTCGGLICRISEKISLILGIAQNIFAQNPFDACSISLQSQIISAQNLCRVQNPFNLKIPCLTIPSGYKVPLHQILSIHPRHVNIT